MRSLFLVALLVLLGAFGAAFWVLHDYGAAGPLSANRIVVLPHGESVPALARRLGANDVVAHPLVFIVGLYVTGQYHTLKAGEYEFTAGISPSAAAGLMASGRVVQHRLTVPEGVTSADIVTLLKSAPALTGNIAQTPADGTLLPETYFYLLGDSRQELLARMHRAMDTALREAWAQRSPHLPFSRPEDAVILASIVEKEARKPEERGRIAGVYINRLRLGMKLQADPTIAYALSHGGEKPLDRPLAHDDLAVASPYNTYLEKGLPPTPIANPGRAALLAAVQPEATDDLYFVSDGMGGHNFARSLDEQDRNIAILRQQQQTEPH
jgi:UPF0755 protein